LAVGRYDANDNPDIVIGDNAATRNLMVYLSGVTSMVPRVETTLDAPRALALGRLRPESLVQGTNGDLYDDIVLGADAGFAIRAYANGAFNVGTPLLNLGTANSPRELVLGRFATAEGTGSDAGVGNDANDFIDIAVAELGSASAPSVQFFRQSGVYSGGQLVNTVFEPAATLNISGFGTASTIETADFNLDGRSDVIVTGRYTGGSGMVAVYAANSLLLPFSVASARQWTHQYFYTGASVSDAEPGDFDGDGDADIIVGVTGTALNNGLGLLENTKAGDDTPAGAGLSRGE
jgi:hypothetical protein